MKFIAVTNRSLCLDDKDFFTRIESLCDVLRKGDKILLREPKLEVPEYTTLAEECRDICHDTPIHLLLHTHFETAKALHLKQVHLPMALLRVGIPIGYLRHRLQEGFAPSWRGLPESGLRQRGYSRLCHRRHHTGKSSGVKSSRCHRHLRHVRSHDLRRPGRRGATISIIPIIVFRFL